MKYLLLIFLFLPFLAFSQEENKYLTGAVPVVNGKVIFERTYTVPSLSQDQLYNRLLQWAEKRFKTEDTQKGRILYANKEKGEIACRGEEYLTFANTALSLDRALITYLMTFEITPRKCEVKISGIRYDYYISSQNNPEKYTAEEIITDKYALNKNKDKVLKKIGKFRIHTIDLVDTLYKEVEKVIGPTEQPKNIASAPVYTSSISSNEPQKTLPAYAPAASDGSMEGYRRIAPDKIPGNIIKMLSEDWMLITAGNDSDFNTMTASWGGLGHLYNKPVTFCFINPARYTYKFMETKDTYTLTFYTEAYRDVLNYCGHNSGKDGDKIKATGLTPVTTPSGAKAFGEAWMIIECRKLVSQSLIPEALSDPTLKADWTGKPMHKMYIGEILNVWIK